MSPARLKSTNVLAPNTEQNQLGVRGKDEAQDKRKRKQKKKTRKPSKSKQSRDEATTWLDPDIEDNAIVARRMVEILTQVRNRRVIRVLKQIYRNACLFCGSRLHVGREPDRYYSEAAHIKPLGYPFDGPDVSRNMIILCPNHHLQFDRGMISVYREGETYTVRSKVSGDPVHNKPIVFDERHSVDDEYIDWHYEYWFTSKRG